MEFLDEIIDLLNSGEFQKIIDSIGDFLDENPAYKTIDYHHFANPLEEMLFDNYLGNFESIKTLDLDKPLEDIKFVFTGDIRNNVCYGLMYGAVKMGMHFVCLGPKSLHIDPEVLAYCKEEAKKSGGTIEVTDNVDEAVKDADVIYTDIWVSMGEDESLYKPRVEMLSPYKVTQEMMSKTGKDSTLFMHCLPSFHDFETTVAKTKHDEGIDIREVEDEVFRSKNSVVFDEAENRMHTIKAVMVATIGRDA